jgi:ELWxxDGT repeat protein
MIKKTSPRSGANRAGRAVAAPVALVLLLAFTYTSVPGQSQLLKDINLEEDQYHNEYAELTDGSGKIYFVVNNTELWKTTGNEGGTVKLKAFKTLKNLTLVGTTLYFAADDGNGMELWKSSGTYASTIKVKQSVFSPESLINANGILYFSAYTPAHGIEIWKSNGTDEGTVLVKDVRPGRAGSYPVQLTHINGTIYFAAHDGKTGLELWKTNGTATGTVLVKDIRPGASLSSAPDLLTNVDGTLFFAANDGTSGRELWKTDGTAATTTLVRDIRPGLAHSSIKNLTAVNNSLFFSANDGVHGEELWKSNGLQGGTVMVKDLTAGRIGSSHGQTDFMHDMGNFKSVFGFLYFTAYQDDIYYIWKSDGTEAGTVPLYVASNGIVMPAPRFVAMKNYIYFFNSVPDEQGDESHQLFRMNPDGSGAVSISPLHNDDYYDRYNPELVVLFNSLFFWGRDSALQGFKLFRSSGVPGSMYVIKDVYKITLTSSPYNMVKTGNNQIFFAAEEPTFSSSLWRTDGTTAGTIELHELDYMNDIVATNTHVFYSLNAFLDIWKSDGTPAGTVLVKTDPNIASARYFVNVNNLVFFETHDTGLWRSDGTEAGTFRLPATQAASFRQAVGNLLYFSIRKPDNVVELWRSDGTTAGTYSIKTFRGQQQPYYNYTTAIGNVLYFLADDGITGNEVWRTDGTANGTYLVADLNSGDNLLNGPYEADIRTLGTWNNNLYISAYDNTGNWALYKSNGAPGNVTKLADVNPIPHMIPAIGKMLFFPTVGPEYWRAEVTSWATDGTAEGTTQLSDVALSHPLDYAIINNVAYYKGYQSDMWRSDGTACGTYAIDLGVPSWNMFENIGNIIVFAGESIQHGVEPFTFDLNTAPASPCGTTMSATVSATEDPNGFDGVSDTPYPNPFTTDFSFRINAGENDFISVKAYTSTGFPVEEVKGMKANADYKLGSTWPAGLYFLNINISGKIITRQVRKK